MFDKHTLKVLEFPKIISLIEGRCLTPYGKSNVVRIAPLSDSDEIKKKWVEISQMKDIIKFGRAFPLYNLENCREELKKSDVEGGFLDPEEILLILHLIEVSIDIHGYDPERRENFPNITEYLEKIRAFPELKKEIRRSIDDDGTIKDNATSTLKQIRNDLRTYKQKIITKLTGMQTAQPSQAGWQDDIVTMRNGRYVISVPSNRYQSNMGILHDRSQTGATLYIEPTETVELNNKLNILAQDERFEMDRILRAITTEIAKRSEALFENTRIIGKLDALYACAHLSIKTDGNAPTFAKEASFNLIDVKHPLLLIQTEDHDSVIPCSLSLDDSRQAILVTGPNTGGKTIVLKNVGLAIIMAQSGLHISADEKSTVGMFNNVMADIGDEQSIELSLSTFSSHMQNIIHSVRQASSHTLILFDEIGAGTDPKEGSALAESILLYAINKKARIIATTHYSQLKTLAMEHPELENASLEFDKKTLTPTYQVRIGIPGSSYAVEIARRLGLPKSICENASSLIGSGERSLSSLISSLEGELAIIKKDRVELTERLKKAEEFEKYYKERSEKLSKDIEEEKIKGLSETEAFLNETRREIEQMVAEIRDSQANKDTLKKFHKTTKDRQQKIKIKQAKLEKKPIDPGRFEAGDRVEILSLQQKGEIEQLIGNNRARIKVGNILTTVEIRNLRKLDQLSTSNNQHRKSYSSMTTDISPEIHLRGMTGEEALEALDKYLDKASISGLNQVYVIHGKGTGALRKILTAYLQKHPVVESIRLGDWNEGGSGVTIVKLKA